MSLPSLLLVVTLIFETSGFNFMSPYGGQTVTGVVGSSFHFKWRFTAGLGYIQWGLKANSQNHFESNGILVTVDALGKVQLTSRSEYATRVNGTIDVSSGQATFILSNLKRADGRFYGAMINPLSGDDLPVFDSVQLVLKEGALTITREPKNPTYVPKGGTAVLKWDYSAGNKTTELQEIVWRVLHTDGITYPLIIEDNKGKAKLSRNIPQAYISRVEKKPPATLVVRNVIFNDSTEFSFTLEGVLGVASSQQSAIDLIVTGPAVCTPEVQFAKRGKDVTFTCNATNVPRQNFTWDNPKQTASSDSRYSYTSITGSSQVTIKSISASDLGYHVCDATVNPDQPNSCTVFLQVPEVSVEVTGEEPCPKRSYTPCIGDNQTICCPIKIGYPPPIVTWEKNGIQLQKGENTDFTITSVEDKDFGNYTCTATNFETTIGPFFVDVQKCEGALTITEKPDNPTYVQKEDTAVLKWNYTADDKTTELQEILWRVLHVDGVTYPLIIEDNKGKVKLSRNIPQAYASRVEKKARATLLVRNVTFNDSTQFTFVLQGVLGVASSKQSAIDLIVTGPAVCTPEVQFAKLGTDVTFTCNATNVPIQNFTWDNPKQTASSDSRYSYTSITGSSQVTIKSISASDLGYHVCDATVNPDQPNSCTVYLQVPEVSVEVKGEEPCPKRSYTPCIGDNQTICCPIKIGYAPPIVTWEKNGIELQKGENTDFTITSVEDKDFGNYTCAATNFETTIGPFFVDVQKCVCEDDPDYADGCPEQAAIPNYCEYLEDFMRKHCPKSCGFCSREP